MKKYLITILLICFEFAVEAQQKLSLADCREMALQNSEEIRIARLQTEKARAERAAMKTKYLPSVSGSALGVYLQKDIEMELYTPTAVPNPATGELVPNVMKNPYTGEAIIGADGNPVFNMYAWMPLAISLKGAYLAGISVEQPLYAGGKINSANALAELGIEMASENLILQRINALYETDQAYWLYVSVQEKVKLAKAYNLLLNELEKRVGHLFETGMTTRNELLKVTVRHNESKLQLQKAESGLQLTRMALCRITGLPFDTAIETTDSILFQDQAVMPTTADSDVTLRPEYRLLQKNTDMAEEQVRLSKADFLPTVGISAGYNYAGGIELGTFDYHSSNASVLASLKIPVFHWGEGRLKQQSAKSELEINRIRLEKNTRLMMLEMEQARFNVRDASVRTDMARQLLEQAEENLRVQRDNYELGMGLLTDLLEAQAHWQNAFSETIEARIDLKLKETALLKATGNLK